MPAVSVEAAGRDTFRVMVTGAGSSTKHVVSVTPEDVARFGPGHTPEHLVEASFRFLLDREPPEAILERFDLAVISRYFPEYPSTIGDYL
jgi:hypothetical protein